MNNNLCTYPKMVVGWQVQGSRLSVQREREMYPDWFGLVEFGRGGWPTGTELFLRIMKF
jgi:hypothetical protein